MARFMDASAAGEKDMLTHSRSTAAGVAVLLMFLAIPGTASAQGGSSPEQVRARLTAAAGRSLVSLPPSLMAERQETPSARDSLANGTIIGAVVGAAALGIVGSVVCKVLQAEGDPSCVDDIVRLTAIGAAIGAGAGLGIDAALTRGHGVRLAAVITF
jgi:hypothetical protein